MRLLYLFAVALLAACSSQPQQPTTYLLRSDVATTPGQELAASDTGLGNIRVATYIEQPGLVLATGDGRVHAARNHLWAEPLQVSLRRYLANEIAQASGRQVSETVVATTSTRIDVTIDQLHGDGLGSALLVAYWEVEAGGEARRFQFAERQALANDGYDALVQAEESLLRQLAGAIAKSL